MIFSLRKGFCSVKKVYSYFQRKRLMIRSFVKKSNEVMFTTIDSLWSQTQAARYMSCFKCVVIWFILDFDFIFRYLWNNHRVWNKGKPNLNHRLNRTIKYKLYLLMLAFRLLLRWKVLYVGCVLLCRNRYHGEIVSGVVLKFKRPRHSWWVFQTQIADDRISEFVICEPFTVLFSTLYGYYFKVSI